MVSNHQPLGEVARHQVPLFLFLERRLCGVTNLPVSTNRATGVESATGGGIERSGNLSLEQETPPGALGGRIGDRRRRQESVGVRVERFSEEGIRGSHLDNLAQIHDSDSITDVSHHRQIVGYEEIGESEAGLELVEQVEDLRLDRYIERGYGLVGDNETGV
jgi:hypothetical protein